METALRARTQAELSRLLEDLPPGGRLTRGLTGLVASLSALTARVGAAWRAPRLPRLTLPPQSLPRLLVGRAPICQIVMTDLSVSRLHAELRRAGDTWLLSDLGSMNGTRVNGYRIAGPTRVLPGDEVAFGDIRFIVCGNAPR